ncbi:hypothetical protein [Candidatus Rhodobacter oscarellae]|uniref:hypothetical protein n=1 Tax=Candidatus Rhodobacter oscarellae TaxID=1675527 RepID=UPI000A48BADC|nr:hypothetical protein [Candidatus Rhodobacter lobularis]
MKLSEIRLLNARSVKDTALPRLGVIVYLEGQTHSERERVCLRALKKAANNLMGLPLTKEANFQMVDRFFGWTGQILGRPGSVHPRLAP